MHCRSSPRTRQVPLLDRLAAPPAPPIGPPGREWDQWGVAGTRNGSWPPGSHAGRCRDDAAFATLAGTAPIPASSGKTVLYRLNQSGDRQVNRAIHTVALSRRRHRAETRAYTDRRRSECKTDREIKRCLKRYITRQLYRQLETRPVTPPLPIALRRSGIERRRAGR